MDQMNEKPLPENFARAMADVPPLPGHVYGAIARKINRGKIIMRSVWAAAASLIIVVSAFTAFRVSAPQETSNAEISDEVACINDYFNSDDLQDDDNATYENDED